LNVVCSQAGVSSEKSARAKQQGLWGLMILDESLWVRDKIWGLRISCTLQSHLGSGRLLRGVIAEGMLLS